MDRAEMDFEAAVEAVITGELEALQHRIKLNPRLVTSRSSKPHGATLLHYVAANGVEMERQITPPNAAAVAQLLLASGADADATARLYERPSWDTPLIALVTSVHPARAGVQGDVADVLLDYGAKINGLDDDGAPVAFTLAFGYTATADLLAARGAKIDNLHTAAGLGQLEHVQSFFKADGSLRDGDIGLKLGSFMPLFRQPQDMIDWAFIYACMHKRLEVAQYLLDRGADMGARGYQGMTALHYAVWKGQDDVMSFLLEREAPLEITNDYGGTVLGMLVWCIRNDPLPGVNYAEMLHRLLAAGASTQAVVE